MKPKGTAAIPLHDRVNKALGRSSAHPNPVAPQKTANAIKAQETAHNGHFLR
ncbi:MAG: hypothetical protein V1918_04250 [Planctomycetota bacterium]